MNCGIGNVKGKGGGLKSNGIYTMNSNGGLDIEYIDTEIIALPKTDIINTLNNNGVSFDFDLQIGDLIISDCDGIDIHYGSICLYIGDKPNDSTKAMLVISNNTMPFPIIVNPTATGSEVDLERITINNINYKIGGGKQLYQHNITICFATTKQSTFFGGQVTLSILNSDSTMFTKQLLAQWLHTNYPTSYTKIKGASGSIRSYSKTAKEVVSGVTSGADTSINIHFDLSSGDSPSQYYDTLEIDSINYFEDKTEII